MYKTLNPGDNSHVVVNKRKCFSTSRQIRAHLLCQECEQMFSRNGEHWTMQNGYRRPGQFNLQALLQSAVPLANTKWGAVVSGAATPKINVNALCYFAMSVFWRSSVHLWDGEEQIDLGARYNEQFRQYLMGAIAFPANANLVIHVSNAVQPMAASFTPSGGREQGPNGRFCRYSFYMPGILFWLVLGASAPRNVKKLLCAAHSPGRSICLTDQLESLVESMAIDLVSQNESLRREILAGSDRTE